MTAAGWHPDPAGVPGRLRWWDGQRWTDHVHEQAAPVAESAAAGSPLDAAVLVVAPPRVAALGTRVFELEDGGGGRLGRMVETSRGVNDSAFGALLSRAKGWQHTTTRELRGPRGYPELVLTWTAAGAGGPEAGSSRAGSQVPAAELIVVTQPDRSEVGTLRRGIVDGQISWLIVSADGRAIGAATPTGATGTAGERLSEVTPAGEGGWCVTVGSGRRDEPLRSLVIAAAAVADLL